MELPIKNVLGQGVGTLDVSDAVFAIPFREPVVHQVMVAQLANRRVGTHSTKRRGEVRGGGRKPWRQKGTGRARQGSIRSPQWRGGGIVFGPKPRDYHQLTPKKMRRLAIRCLLAQKIREDAVTLLDELNIETSKTKEILKLLSSLGINSKCLVVDGGPRADIGKACRNLGAVKSLPASTLNSLDLLNYDHLILSVSAVRRIEELWGAEYPRTKYKRLAGNLVGDLLIEPDDAQEQTDNDDA